MKYNQFHDKTSCVEHICYRTVPAAHNQNKRQIIFATCHIFQKGVSSLLLRFLDLFLTNKNILKYDEDGNEYIMTRENKSQLNQTVYY